MLKYIISLIIFSIAVPAEATWQEILENAFPNGLVETFDELNDWKGNAVNGEIYDTGLPTKIGGGNSIWNGYEYNSYSLLTNDWIQNHGALNVWRGLGKSLRMDVPKPGSSEARSGPQRFYTYFGGDNETISPYASSGQYNYGPKEVYVFFIVKIPHTTLLPKYEAYWKFFCLCTGFISTDNPIYARSTYGPANTLTNDSYYSYAYHILKTHWTLTDENEDVIWQENYKASPYSNGDITDYVANDQWFGIELRLKLGTPGGSDTQMELWVYDNNGNVEHLINITDLPLHAGYNGGINKFFFGGNKSWDEESGETSHYFVDDLIIHGNRIGPTYFNLIDGDIDAPESPHIIGITVGN